MSVDLAGAEDTPLVIELEGPAGANFTITVASAGVEESGRFDRSGRAEVTLDLPAGEHEIAASVAVDGESSELATEVVTIAAVDDGADEASAVPGFLMLGGFGGAAYWWWRRRTGRRAAATAGEGPTG